MKYTYNYYDNITPSFEQLCTYKSVKPIDVNNDTVQLCLEWLERYQNPYKLLLEDYLETIYDFAGGICDGVFIVPGLHRLQYNINEFWNVDVNAYTFYNPHTDNTERLFSNDRENRENIILEEFNVLINTSELTKSNFAISIIYNLQRKLNPIKYKQNITDIIPSDIQINAMNLLYYISNQLVQLSHDVIYAINKRIDKYIYNNNADKLNIKTDIIQTLS